jgi:glycerol-3-phosphate dehydrogenase subunit C
MKMNTSGQPNASINQLIPLELSLDQCIKCNICLSACPVSAVTDLFPGPKYTAPQAGRFRGSKQHSPDFSVDYCSGCRACNLACPSGVKIAEMNARARARMVEDGSIPFPIRLRNNLVARSATIGKYAQPLYRLANFMFFFPPARLLADRILHIAREAPFPHFAGQKFTTWFKKHQPPRVTTGKVVYFHGCSTQYYEPQVGKAAVQVLETLGLEVIVPTQGCCGLPLISNGEFQAARRWHASNVKQLVEFARQGIPIVGTSTSCTLTLKEEAPELLDFHDEEAQLVASMTFDFSEFLLILLEQGRLDLDLLAIPMDLPYHIPCQYRAHRLGSPAVEILGLIPELHLVESKAACCGIAGTYGYKSEKYPIAMQVGAPLFAFARQSEAPFILCDSETCRWQITHATQMPAFHPVELLAYACAPSSENPLHPILSPYLKSNERK